MGNKVNKLRKFSQRQYKRQKLTNLIRTQGQTKCLGNTAKALVDNLQANANKAAAKNENSTKTSMKTCTNASTGIFSPTPTETFEVPVRPVAITMTETKKEVVDEEVPLQHPEDVECRACLQRFDYEAGLLDVFQAWDPPWNGMGESIAQDLTQITNVEVSPVDSYSKLICQFCHQKLLDACSFVVNVRINDRLLRQRAETLHEPDHIWPKPIQVDRNINSNIFNTPMDVEIKQEVLSEDETYSNCPEDAFKDAEIAEGTDNAFNSLEIKIEPEEIMRPTPYQITVNEPSTSATKKTKRDPRIIQANEYITRLAVNDVLAGKSVRSTAKAYGISPKTVYQCMKKTKTATEEIVPAKRLPHVFSEAQELELVGYLKIARKHCHGLTPTIVRQFAYQYANGNINSLAPTWAANEAATYDWFYKFMNRHKDLTMRGPQTSLPRDNRHVDNFFEDLKGLLDQCQFRPEQIWNVDETAVTTLAKPNEASARKVPNQAAKLSAGETVTVCGAINAAGDNLPPFIIFPRKLCQKKMTDGVPGTHGTVHPSGSMNGDIFLTFLKFFVRHVGCSKESPCLIVLDSHESHITIDSISFCKDSGIELLTTPPYMSQKLQPLSPIFMHLKMYYSLACDDWIGHHPGDALTTNNFAECLGNAYPNVMIPSIIQKRFSDIGICPFNPSMLTNEFLSAEIEIQDVKSLAQGDAKNNAQLHTFPTLLYEQLTAPVSAIGRNGSNREISTKTINEKRI